MPRQKRKQNRKEEEEEEERQERSRSRERERCFQEDYENQNQEEDHEVEEQEESQKNDSVQEKRGKSQTVALNLRQAFLDFFGMIKHQKGFVFTPQQRSKLQKQQIRKQKNDKNHVVIPWNNECQWVQEEEKAKIVALLMAQNLELSEQQLLIIKEVFLFTSYLFGKETTGQLYSLLLAILKIVLAYPTQYTQSASRVRGFVNGMRNDKTHYKFFNYDFSSYYTLEVPNIDEIYNDLAMDIAKQLRMALNE